MYKKIAKIFALIILIESCVVMTGWFFSIDILTRFLPNSINMKFPTALMFFFTAIGLYLIIKTVENNNKFSQVILPGISLFIFLVMSAVFAAQLTGGQTGIESLFVVDKNPTIALGSGFPSLFTAINFIIFGLACLIYLFPNQKNYFKTKYFGYPIFFIGLIAVFGYLLQIPVLYFQFNTSSVPMAINTALTFVLLGSSLIIISPSTTHEA